MQHLGLNPNCKSDVISLSLFPTQCNQTTLQQELSRIAEMRTVATKDMGGKQGDCCAPFAGGAGSPSNTMWPGPRSTSVPSGVFNHPAVWPQ